MLMCEIMLCAIGVRHVSIIVFPGGYRIHMPGTIFYGRVTVSRVGDRPRELPSGRRGSIVRPWDNGVLTIGGGREVVLTTSVMVAQDEGTRRRI